uniref:MHC class I-like antigen recognition-like domain-containing protein n=1 Tax=Spermophilus dauricus TaxID=99837 RepID=A0A8C9Q7J3_SPEDA
MHKQLRRKCILLLLGGIFSRSLLSPFGTHSLHYNLTVRSQGGSVQSRFFAEGYWDHQLFLQYDSDKKESAKPQELWAEKPLGTESWDTEIQELAEHSKDLKATLANINALQEQKGGSHSLQETWGCKTEEDNHTRGFWDFHYDGEPFLSYHPETRSWKVEPSSAQTLAMEVKNSWDADGIQSKVYQAHVQGELWYPESTILLSGTALLLESQWPPLWWYALLLLGLFSCIPLCKKRRTSAEEGSELVSLKVLDQQQRAPSDHTGSTQLGCQPLLRAPEAS